MARKAKKSNIYFTKITEIAIIAYNKTDSPVRREKIYRRFIYPAFMKLAENTINKIKPDYILIECTHKEEIFMFMNDNQYEMIEFYNTNDYLFKKIK